MFRVYSLWIDWFDTHKQTQWIKDLKVRPDILKLLDENTGRTLFAINHSNIFCQTSPRVKEIKKKKRNLIKLKRFSTAKETVNKTNRKPTEWKKIFENFGANKGFVSKNL